MTGIWVLAHECGHQAFSPYAKVNDFFGWLMHSSLFVPYHAWRVSHANHHANTNHMEHDEVFIPHTRSAMGEAITESPLANLIEVLTMLTFGWPAYLIVNIAGPKKYQGKPNSHFTTNSALFEKKDAFGIIASNVGLMIAFSVLLWAIATFSFITVLKFYIVPYLIVNGYLVSITFLQHTDTYIPHYRGQVNPLRGALATVDRSLGPVIDHFIHHIADTHVLHHISAKIPFFKAQEATKRVKEVLGKYHLEDRTNFLYALWRSWNKCKFVEDEGEVLWFKKSFK